MSVDYPTELNLINIFTTKQRFRIAAIEHLVNCACRFWIYYDTTKSKSFNLLWSRKFNSHKVKYLCFRKLM